MVRFQAIETHISRAVLFVVIVLIESLRLTLMPF